MITIHFNDTTLDVQESDDSYRYRSLMGDHNLTLKFSLPEYVEIPVGAWCEYMAIRYTLATPANIKKNGTRDIEYTLIMESAQYQLNRYKLRNTVDKRLKFSMCATPKEYIQVIVDNLNQRDSGWAVGDCIVSTEKTIAFDHSFVSDALQSVADTFNSEWEIVGKTIHLKKVEYFKDDPLPLSYGKGNGFVPGVGRTTETGSRPVEILFVQGGSQNIDRSKYGSAELLLPKSQTLEYEGRTYISDADGYSIRRQDKAVLYNNEDSLDCSEIYPSRVGKVTKVEVIDEANNFYDIIDNTIPENLNYNDYLIEGENMTIIFQSGMLAGDDKAFELKYNHAERRFEIVPQEIDGLTMPGGVYIPHEGDTYAIFGCMLPDAYICDNATKTGASWDMFREAARYLYENEDTKFTFSGELQGMWAKRNWLKVGGKLVVGGYVLFTDNQFAPDGVKIRITGIKDYLTSPYAPTVELSNSVSGKSLNSTLNELENGNVIVDENQKKIIQFTKRRFRDSLETIDMLEQALLENFTNSINPIAVQTMAMLVGDESLQFRFVNSNLNPIQYHITYNQETKQLIAPATVLQHMTLGIDTITSNRDKNTYKHWTMSGYTSPVLDQISQKYYFYAKVPTGTGTGEFVLSPTAIGMNDVSGYYHLLVGVLNSEYDGERSFATLYGFTEVLPGRITTDRIVSADGKTYFDLANSIIGGNIRFRSTNGTDKNVSDLEDELNERIDTQAQEFVEAVGGLQSQIDGAIESFFYEYNPTTSNVPASQWTTTEEKNKHLNDTFTNLKTGRSWRWTKSGSSYSWVEITDTATVEALAKAGKAQDTADSKRRVFVSTPYPPYDIGDLWVQGTSGDIMRCKTARASGSYYASDWVKASKYTDDSSLNNFINGDFKQLKQDAVMKETIIEGGYLKNSLIDTENLLVENIYSKNGNFQTTEDGTVKGRNAVFEGGTFTDVLLQGSLRNPFVQETDSIVVGGNQSTHDNVATISVGGGWITAGNLEWDVKQSGRRMCITNYRWGSQYSQGTIEYTAPTGKYFYENGRSKEYLKLSRECVELIGYGTSSQFYGWIVLNRINLMTDAKYGRKLNSLAMGIVTGTSSGASISYKTYDNLSTLSVSRLSTGKYRVYFPSSWKLISGSYIVMMTGYGGGVMKATLLETATSYFTVEVSDDASVNDGSFMFMMLNMNDWMEINS
jgi:hypothetical protein|nr:MAG TPA: Putative tail protein [Herelleviridae sp.]